VEPPPRTRAELAAAAAAPSTGKSKKGKPAPKNHLPFLRRNQQATQGACGLPVLGLLLHHPPRPAALKLNALIRALMPSFYTLWSKAAAKVNTRCTAPSAACRSWGGAPWLAANSVEAAPWHSTSTAMAALP
jgi:hypothetical protein